MKKKGSAILTVIGTVSVLVVLAFAFISSSRDKAGLSRMMSDEKKCEAIAESATDFILQYIKKNANDHESSNPAIPIYKLLRAPLKIKTKGSDGKNHILEVSETKKIELDFIPYPNIVDPVIKDFEWEGKVDITATCELCNAEAFTGETDDYKVTTIDYKHLPAVSDSAKFLDDLSNTATENADSDSWKNFNWKVQIMFPEKGKENEEEVVYPLDGEFGDYDTKIKVIRCGETAEDSKFTVDIDLTEVPGIGVILTAIASLIHIEIDLQEKLDETHFFPDNIQQSDGGMTLKGFKNTYSDGADLNYDFSNYLSSMTQRKGEIDYGECFNSGFNIYSNTDFGDDSVYLEKGGVLRIITKVKYNKSEGNVIERDLVAEIPFKTSDVQPIGPEYSFFIANTKYIGGDDPNLGGPIDLNVKGEAGGAGFYDSTPPAGQFIVHNLPINMDSDPKTIEFSKVGSNSDGTRIPGMVRINSDYDSTSKSGNVSQIRNFFGIVKQPELTEFNKFMMPFNSLNDSTVKNNFNTFISFIWEDKDGNQTPAKKYHDIELPVIFEDGSAQQPPEPGIENILAFVKDSGFLIVSVPTLLFGTGHLEYPLGLVAEGPIDTIFSRTRLCVKPQGKLQLGHAILDALNPFNEDDAGAFEEQTEVSYKYENVTNFSQSADDGYEFDNTDSPDSRDPNRVSGYGMSGYKQNPLLGYDKTQAWACNDDYQYCPANCYDAYQYAKKATKYYDDAGEFNKDITNKKVKDGGLVGDDGSVELNGVYYVKAETLTLPSFKYKGHGIIVCKNDISIDGDITRADDEGTLGIIARKGMISFNTAKVEASCFSCSAPLCSKAKFELHGNLVCNTFDRSQFGVDSYIFYDNTLCTVTPLASNRKVGKFEPKRYAVAFAENWSKFKYEKQQDEEGQ